MFSTRLAITVGVCVSFLAPACGTDGLEESYGGAQSGALDTDVRLSWAGLSNEGAPAAVTLARVPVEDLSDYRAQGMLDDLQVDIGNRAVDLPRAHYSSYRIFSDRITASDMAGVDPELLTGQVYFRASLTTDQLRNIAGVKLYRVNEQCVTYEPHGGDEIECPSYQAVIGMAGACSDMAGMMPCAVIDQEGNGVGTPDGRLHTVRFNWDLGARSLRQADAWELQIKSYDLTGTDAFISLLTGWSLTVVQDISAEEVAASEVFTRGVLTCSGSNPAMQPEFCLGAGGGGGGAPDGAMIHSPIDVRIARATPLRLMANAYEAGQSEGVESLIAAVTSDEMAVGPTDIGHHVVQATIYHQELAEIENIEVAKNFQGVSCQGECRPIAALYADNLNDYLLTELHTPQLRDSGLFDMQGEQAFLRDEYQQAEMFFGLAEVARAYEAGMYLTTSLPLGKISMNGDWELFVRDTNSHFGEGVLVDWRLVVVPGMDNFNNTLD